MEKNNFLNAATRIESVEWAAINLCLCL